MAHDNFPTIFSGAYDNEGRNVVDVCYTTAQIFHQSSQMLTFHMAMCETVGD
jgi:hypothetical protein